MQQFYQSIFAEQKTRLQPLWKSGKPIIEKIDRELIQSPKLSPIKIRDSQDNLVSRGHYHLINEFLISNSCYINITNLKLNHVSFKKNKGIQMSGKNECVQLFGDKDQIGEWFKYVAKYTVQENFYKKFDVIKIIGKGSHAKVYQIKRVSDNEIFAVKVFKKTRLLEKKNGQESLLKEIDIMRRFDHSGVINLHEVFEDEDYVYLIIDFLHGGELLKQIENCENGYSEQLVQKIMNNLLSSLRYIHSKGILHRDLKPENLILRIEDDLTDLVIADFGLSDIYNEKCDYMFQRCGTVGFVAPEVLKDGFYDFKVDMFSAGVIMFILLTGEIPFANYDDSDELLTSNLLCSIDYNILSKKSITPQAQDLVRLLLDENVSIRPSAEQALLHDWFCIPSIQSLQSLSMTKIPQIGHHQNPDLFCSTPLWNQELHSEQLSPLELKMDDIDESTSEKNYFNQFIKSDQYEIGEDCIDEEKSPSQMVPKYKLLVRQRSLE